MILLGFSDHRPPIAHICWFIRMTFKPSPLIAHSNASTPFDNGKTAVIIGFKSIFPLANNSIAVSKQPAVYRTVPMTSSSLATIVNVEKELTGRPIPAWTSIKKTGAGRTSLRAHMPQLK